MPVMDEFREERESIKNGTLKQKWQYFKDYYLLTVVIVLVAAIFIGAFLYNYVSAKENAFYAIMLNASSYDENEWFANEYMLAAGIDTDKCQVIFDDASFYKLNSNDEVSYTTMQKLQTYAGAGQLDAMLGTGEEFKYFANGVVFMDLHNLLSEEQLAKYEPYFYYVDDALLNKADENAKNQLTIDTTNIPDPRKPEDMEQPTPVAIYVESSDKLNQSFYFPNAEDGIAIGIYSNTSHPENAVSFIEYLLSE